jgi:hypothetical protein
MWSKAQSPGARPAGTSSSSMPIFTRRLPANHVNEHQLVGVPVRYGIDHGPRMFTDVELGRTHEIADVPDQHDVEISRSASRLVLR